jgi:hypothetical protein
MRSSRFRLPVLAAILWVGAGSSVWALGYNRSAAETVYVLPSTTTLAVPTSYLVSSSYVLPSAYYTYTPTYYSTTYVSEPVVLAPTSYVATAYYSTWFPRLRGLFNRPLVATSATTYVPTTYATAYYFPTYYSTYRPTAYYTPTVLSYPTVWETAYVTSPTSWCDEVASTAAPRSATPSTGAAGARGGEGSRTVQSQPTEESAIPSTVPPPPAREPAAPNRSREESARAKIQNPPGGGDNTPPTPIPVPREQTTAPRPDANRSAGGQGAGSTTERQTGGATTTPSRPNPPNAPGQQDGRTLPLEPSDAPGTVRSESRRPAFPSRTLRTDLRNVLRGSVVSQDSGEPLEGVRLAFSSRTNTMVDRVTLSDAFGHFAIRLPDGDWTVKVTMPSGRASVPMGVRYVTASNGKVTDEQGVEIPSLLIER